MKKTSYLALVLILGILISGCENSNIFSWTHARGKDSSPESLLADAEKAMNDKNYDDAIEYYEKILEKDPDNSNALYGKAAAELKDAGLDIADLIPKLLDQDEAAANNLLENIDFSDLANGTEEAIDALKIIANGRGDGTIPADDFDVNLNLGVALVINAAANLMVFGEASGAIDVNDDYSIDVDGFTGTDADLKEQLENTLEAITEAITYLEVAESSLPVDVGTSDAGSIDDIIAGFDDFILELEAKIDDL